jgi:hypothetical protein
MTYGGSDSSAVASSQFLVGKLPRVQAHIICNYLAFAVEFPFADEEAVESYGATGVDFAGADTDFGA